MKLPKDLNLVYTEKVDLIYIAKTINSLTKHQVDLIINNEISSNAYTGDGIKLESLGITLKGLTPSIRHVYNILKERRKHNEKNK